MANPYEQNKTLRGACRVQVGLGIAGLLGLLLVNPPAVGFKSRSWSPPSTAHELKLRAFDTESMGGSLRVGEGIDALTFGFGLSRSMCPGSKPMPTLRVPKGSRRLGGSGEATPVSRSFVRLLSHSKAEKAPD